VIRIGLPSAIHECGSAQCLFIAFGAARPFYFSASASKLATLQNKNAFFNFVEKAL
jgi:hypothetical protein